MNWWQRFKRSSAHIQASVVMSAFVAVATVAYSIIAAVQLGVMRQASDDSAAQASKLIDAADQIKSAAWDFKGSAQGIDGNLGLAVGKLQGQIDQVKRSADAAKDAVNATLDEMRLEQRPWVGIQQFSCEKCDRRRFAQSNNGPFLGSLKIYNLQGFVVNTGKTPAENIQVIYKLHMGQRWFADDPYDPTKVTGEENANTQTKIIGALSPEQTMQINLSGTSGYLDFPMDAVSPDGTMKSDFPTAYVEGTISYNDVWNKPHATRFCVFAFASPALNIPDLANKTEYCDTKDSNLMK